MNLIHKPKHKISRTIQHADQSRYYACFCHRAFIVLLTAYIIINPLYAQVYNYTPINHYDIETNPSILASGKMNNRAQLIHQNSFPSNDLFSLSSLKLSKYFESSFLGVGLTLNNTNIGSSIKYNHISIGAGYRNVLFNALYLKLGLTYKLISTNSPSGIFDYYTFTPANQTAKNNIKDNANLALSFSSSSNDMYYVSFGVLNLDLPWTNNNIQFPTYYQMNIGNLMNLFDRRNSEISYTAFSKLSKTNNKLTYSQYINLKFNINVTRRCSMNYGSRIGLDENDYYNFIPFIGCYTRKLAVNLSYNFHLDKTNFQSKYYPSSQINIIYIL